MTPQHMESMRMAVTAVVEDMSPVEHEWPGLVHDAGGMSRRPDETGTDAGRMNSSVIFGGGEARLLPDRGEGPLPDDELAGHIAEAADHTGEHHGG